mgnify:CR=1 FL=1|jgi:hypothetical protein
MKHRKLAGFSFYRDRLLQQRMFRKVDSERLTEGVNLVIAIGARSASPVPKVVEGILWRRALVVVICHALRRGQGSSKHKGGEILVSRVLSRPLAGATEHDMA